MHAFTAERIDHAGSISNGNNVAWNTIVGKWTRPQPVRAGEVSAECILFNKETKIGMAALNTDSSAVSVRKKPEVENRAERLSFEVLNAKLGNGRPLRKAAELSCGVDQDGSSN